MITLTIDIGNSRSKFELWNDNGFMYRLNDCLLSADKIKTIVNLHDIEGIIIGSVRKDSYDFYRTLKDGLNCEVIWFDEEEIRKYNSISEYKGKIGADRFAAFLGAETLFPDIAKLIVDAGTAITTDVSDNKGHFLGGNITLGFRSRFKALSDSTSLLPDIETPSYRGSFGYDTVSAIESGIYNGVIGEILYAILRSENEYDTEMTVLTGGDGKLLSDAISGIKNNIIYDPHLVGRGLNDHLRKFCPAKHTDMII